MARWACVARVRRYGEGAEAILWIVDWFKLPRGVLDRVVAYERWYNLQASMVDGGWMSQIWLTRTEVGEDFEKVFSGDERGGAVDDGSNVRAFSSGEFE